MAHPLNLTIDLFLSRMEARGEFDDLSGSGEPIPDLEGPAPSVIDKLLAESDARPVPVLLNIEIAALRERLNGEHDPALRKDIMKELADKQTRLAIEIEAYNR
ncbi:DUF1992 domain-containing protein [Tropicimonas sediminicola]|uniref:Uncharacterized protein n=1 Tax=Tropicimonas sediminicola TaxID=1031541 RepID=A0A239LY18_9RHOB|nr:DUF1992 domain-containing protein [Tropicimonas sediminicola]SNT34693.1 protein of unknown function [Tropicimonas sediminicola]